MLETDIQSYRKLVCLGLMVKLVFSEGSRNKICRFFPGDLCSVRKEIRSERELQRGRGKEDQTRRMKEGEDRWCPPGIFYPPRQIKKEKKSHMPRTSYFQDQRQVGDLGFLTKIHRVTGFLAPQLQRKH